MGLDNHGRWVWDENGPRNSTLLTIERETKKKFRIN